MIIFNATDKFKALDLLENCLDQFVYPRVSDADQMILWYHLEGMKQQPGELSVTCVFEAFPETSLTQLTIGFSPIKSRAMP